MYHTQTCLLLHLHVFVQQILELVILVVGTVLVLEKVHSKLVQFCY